MSEVKRQALESIKVLLRRFPCVALLGARQVGKTTLLQQILPDAPTFDLERRADMARVRVDPDFFLSQFDQSIVLDEAQLCPELFPALRIAIDANRAAKGRFLLSGSSSPELISNLTESLAGRIAMFELGGLELAEFWQRPVTDLYNILDAGNPQQLLDLQPHYTTAELFETLWCGGYPEPALARHDPLFGPLWYENYFATYINRDIRRLFPALQMDTYQSFIQMLCGASGEIINASNFARSLDVSQPTIKSYLRIAEGTFLWRNLPSFSKNITKRVSKMPRGYLRDSGLLCYLLHIHTKDDLRAHPRIGLIWECFIIEQLLRGFGNRLLRVNAYYYRTHHQAEVDLVLETNRGLIPVEIKLGTATDPRRVHALQDFIHEHRCHFGLVVSNTSKVARLLPSVYEIPAACL